jgi:tripartite-type tricarboxylate transporter receptor subunit TctC
VVAYYDGLFARFVKTPSWRKYLEDNLFEDGYISSAELGKFFDQHTDTTRAILKDGGVKVVR